MLIALVSDSHLSARAPEFVANWEAAARAVATTAARLTVHLGDISLDAERWHADLAFARDRVSKWTTPVSCVPGNHDLGTGSGESPLDDASLQRYRSQFGADYWITVAGDWHLVGLNAQLLGTGGAEEAAQWDWLEGHAASAECRQVVLFTHRPLSRPRSSEEARSGRYVPAPARQRLLGGPLRDKLRLVISGHTHQHLDWRENGIRHLWLPSTAFVLPDAVQEPVGQKVVGYALLRLAGASADFELCSPGSMQRHDFSRMPLSKLFTSTHPPTETT